MKCYADLVTINLKGNGIHDEGASHIAKMFHFFEHLHLDASENPIGDTGALLVFEAVRKTTILTILILVDYANFSRDILKALGHNNSLKKLKVVWNELGSKVISDPLTLSSNFIHLVASVKSARCSSCNL